MRLRVKVNPVREIGGVVVTRVGKPQEYATASTCGAIPASAMAAVTGSQMWRAKSSGEMSVDTPS